MDAARSQNDSMRIQRELDTLRARLEEAQAERDTAIKRGVEFYRQVKAREDGWVYAFQCRQERIRGLVAENERLKREWGFLGSLLAAFAEGLDDERQRALLALPERARAALRGEPSHHGGE